MVILLKSARATGQPVTNLKNALGNYLTLLGDLSLPEAEIAERMAAVGRDAGFTPGEFAALRKQLGE